MTFGDDAQNRPSHPPLSLNCTHNIYPRKHTHAQHAHLPLHMQTYATHTLVRCTHLHACSHIIIISWDSMQLHGHHLISPDFHITSSVISSLIHVLRPLRKDLSTCISTWDFGFISLITAMTVLCVRCHAHIRHSYHVPLTL